MEPLSLPEVRRMHKLVSVFLLLWATSGLATTVYKTVDENGVVSFSDTASGGETEVLQISVPPPRSVENHLENLEAMRETTDRMADDRREREKHRAELKGIEAKPRPSPQPVYSEGSTVFSGGYYYPPWRPGYRPKPVHPIIYPPLRPDASVFRGANSQLMRPMLSTGR